MSTGAIIEIAFGLALLVSAVVMYRRRAREGERYGSQGAVLALIVAAILLIHGFGGLDYRPSQGELEALQR